VKKIFAAPFEAEWQLVYFEQNRMISSIISEDGDCLILGAQTVVAMIDWKSGNCWIIRRDKILQREGAGKGRFNDFLPELSSLLGNDYISRLHGHSPKKV
jgi:5'-3' exonuclease